MKTPAFKNNMVYFSLDHVTCDMSSQALKSKMAEEVAAILDLNGREVPGACVSKVPGEFRA